MKEKQSFLAIGALSSLAAVNAFCGLGAGLVLLFAYLFCMLLRPLFKILFADIRPAEGVTIAFFVALAALVCDKFLYFGLEPMRPFFPFLAADGVLFASGRDKKNSGTRAVFELFSLAALLFTTGALRELSGGALFGVTLFEGVPFFSSIGGGLLVFGLLLLLSPVECGNKCSFPLALFAFALTLLLQLAGLEFTFARTTLKTLLLFLIIALPLSFAAERILYTSPARTKKSALILSAGFFVTSLHLLKFL